MTASEKLLPEVEEFLSGSPVRMFIGGEWVEAADGATFETLDPGDGSVLATVAEGKAADVGRAVQAAREAFTKGEWSKMPMNDQMPAVK